MALGLNDFSGGAVNFKSRYLVTSDQYGPLGVSLGYAQGIATQRRQPVFDGLFGGVAWQLAGSGVTLLAEHDGQQKHAGVRWHSPPLPLLGRAQLVGSLQRSFVSDPQTTDLPPESEIDMLWPSKFRWRSEHEEGKARLAQPHRGNHNPRDQHQGIREAP